MAVLDAITFAHLPGEMYLPVREVAGHFRWALHYDPVTELTRVNDRPLGVTMPKLPDGTRLVSLAKLKEWGVTVKYEGGGARLAGPTTLVTRPGAKRVHIDLSDRTLKAFQGARIVLSTSISPGRKGHRTPIGAYRTGKKELMHWSTLYNSPMPFSVHLAGNIFIHGSDRFFDRVGSHGCIRLPVDTFPNLAEWFYNWVSPGVPVRVQA